MQTHSQYSYFKVGEAWTILSDIEQSIKQKVESVGTPLKDWDIEIYRGVLTGYNEAFIISSETREAILDNCKSHEERQRTEEIIRPYSSVHAVSKIIISTGKYDLINILSVTECPSGMFVTKCESCCTTDDFIFLG